MRYRVGLKNGETSLNHLTLFFFFLIPTPSFCLAEQENEVIQFDGLICPTEYHRLPIFAYKCNIHEDCKEFGEICCGEKNWKICRRGVLKRRKEPKHEREYYFWGFKAWTKACFIGFSFKVIKRDFLVVCRFCFQKPRIQIFILESVRDYFKNSSILFIYIAFPWFIIVLVRLK